MRCGAIIVTCAVVLLTSPERAAAQAAGEAGSVTGPTVVEPVAVDLPIAIAAPTSVWVAGVQGGLVDRDDNADSPYTTLSLTRFQKQFYLRAALTVYRSTLRQIDAALPSTYYVGSLGAGGNFNDWVVDAHVSYGRQNYGTVQTDLGVRQSTFTSSSYVAAGLRFGRVFRPASQWFITPTVSAEYVDTKSLHNSPNLDGATDFELPERAWTGAASLRLDRTFGKSQQNYVGLSASHYETNNGLTQALPSPTGGVTAAKRPDSWNQLEASGTVKLRSRLWLDGQIDRSFGALGGDITTFTLGLRFRL